MRAKTFTTPLCFCDVLRTKSIRHLSSFDDKHDEQPAATAATVTEERSSEKRMYS